MMDFEWYKIFDFKFHGEEPMKKNTVCIVEISKEKICVIRNDEGYFAVNNYCPHAGGSLGRGFYDAGKIVCPLHRNRYDIKTGKGDDGQVDKIKTYKTEIRNDGIYVAIQKYDDWKWWKMFSGK